MRRLLYPDGVGPLASVGLLAVRLVMGAAFLFHGWPKIQHPFNWMPPEAPVPGILQAAAAVAEFGGGLAWVLGALTPLFSFLIACTMAFAAFGVHIPAGHPFVSVGGPSFEPALGYLAVALMLILTGPGKLSVDYCLFGRRQAEGYKFRGNT